MEDKIKKLCFYKARKMSFIDLVVCDVYMYTFENRDGTNSLDVFISSFLMKIKEKRIKVPRKIFKLMNLLKFIRTRKDSKRK